MYIEAKKRALLKNIPFNILLEDIIIPEICPVLGIRLKKDNNIISDNSPTLDRLIPEKGYVRGNVFVISNRANMVNDPLP